MILEHCQLILNKGKNEIILPAAQNQRISQASSGVLQAIFDDNSGNNFTVGAVQALPFNKNEHPVDRILITEINKAHLAIEFDTNIFNQINYQKVLETDSNAVPCWIIKFKIVDCLSELRLILKDTWSGVDVDLFMADLRDE